MEDNEQQTIAFTGPPALPAAPACVVVIHGEGFGLRADIHDAPVVIGRSSEAALSIPSPSVSRLHCEIRRIGDSYLIRDLGSTNATRIGGREVQEATLADGDQIAVGGSILKFISHTNVEAVFHERISRLIFRDRLTGLLGRQDFVDAAEQRIADALASGSPLGLALVEVQDIPGIQLERGEEAGDAVLAQVARQVLAQLTDDDLAARIGESRFAVLLSGRDGEAAGRLVTALAAQFSAPLAIEGQAPVRIAIRGGAAQLQPGSGSLGQLIKQSYAASQQPAG